MEDKRQVSKDRGEQVFKSPNLISVFRSLYVGALFHICSRSHTLSPSPSHSLSHFLSVTLTLSHFHSVTLSLTLSHSLSLSLTLSYSHSLFHSHSMILFLTLPLSLSLTLSHSLSLSLVLSCSNISSPLSLHLSPFHAY